MMLPVHACNLHQAFDFALTSAVIGLHLSFEISKQCLSCQSYLHTNGDLHCQTCKHWRCKPTTWNSEHSCVEPKNRSVTVMGSERVSHCCVAAPLPCNCARPRSLSLLEPTLTPYDVHSKHRSHAPAICFHLKYLTASLTNTYTHTQAQSAPDRWTAPSMTSFRNSNKAQVGEGVGVSPLTPEPRPPAPNPTPECPKKRTQTGPDPTRNRATPALVAPPAVSVNWSPCRQGMTQGLRGGLHRGRSSSSGSQSGAGAASGLRRSGGGMAVGGRGEAGSRVGEMRGMGRSAKIDG